MKLEPEQRFKTYVLATFSVLLGLLTITITTAGFCALVGSTSFLSIIGGIFTHLALTVIAGWNLKKFIEHLTEYNELFRAEQLNDQWLKEHAS